MLSERWNCGNVKGTFYHEKDRHRHRSTSYRRSGNPRIGCGNYRKERYPRYRRQDGRHLQAVRFGRDRKLLLLHHRQDRRGYYKKYETNDNLELYYWGADGDASNRGNIHINCLGLGLRLELKYKELGDVIKAAGTVTDTGYITELAVPVTNFELKAGSAFKFSLQYNNYIPADKASIASGYQKTDGAVDLVLSSEKAVAKKDANVDSSAKTLDAGIVSAAAALAASGAAFVSLKKKKR